jgi:hypothetical protein
MKKKLRIIGDAHGWITAKGGFRGRCYSNLVAKAEYSIQLGDFGFEKEYEMLKRFDPVRHRILAGNHDNYDAIPDWPHFLGDFGVHAVPLGDGEFKFFYIRGGRSVDRRDRIEGRSWWRQEELNFQQATEAAKMYEALKPEIVLSHEAPAEVIPFVLRSDNDWGVDPGYTAKLLQACYIYHQPKVWIFGHMHKNWDTVYTGQGVTYRGQQIDNGSRRPTRFICLDELAFVDVDEHGSIGVIQ